MSNTAEQISMAGAPPAPTAPPKSVSPQATGSFKHSGTPVTGCSKLLLISAVGAAIGFMAGVGMYSEIRENSIEFIPIALLAALAAYVFREPSEALKGNEVDESESARRERGLVWALTSAGLGIAIESAFDHSIDAALSKSADKFSAGVVALSNDGLTRTLMVLVVVGLAALGMMSFWVWGAKRRWRAAVAGGAVGLAFGLFACVVGWSVLQYLGGLDALNNAGIHPMWVRIAGAMLILWFLGLGVFGGVAIERRRTSSITIDLVSYLSLFSFAYIALLLLLWHVWKVQYADKSIAEVAIPEFVERWAWLPVAAALFQVVGWSIALHRNRELCEVHLGGRRDAPDSPNPHADSQGSVIGLSPLAPISPAGDPSSTLNPGGSPAMAAADAAGAGVLINFPRANSRTPAQTSVNKQNRAERAKHLLLKPTGDRLLATAALVVALAGTAVAYHLGTLRGDPLILINIAQNLQKDSGLSNKGLQVHSDGRVVTLAGRVDNEAEHAKAVQEVMAVRGVRQLVDQIQVAPAPPGAAQGAVSSQGTTPSGVQGVSPAVNANISVDVSRASSSAGKTTTAGAVKHPRPEAAAGSKTADAQKHHGLFSAFKKKAEAASAQKQQTASKQDAAPKQSATENPSDAAKKKSFFHFLKKDKKDKDGTNKNSAPQ